MPKPAPADDVISLLNDLEDTIATAEELRYRIVVALRSASPAPAQPQNSQAHAPGEPGYIPRRERQQYASPAPVAEGPPPIDTSTLRRTGPGLYAWAREFQLLKAITRIGEEAGFPSRIIAWSQDQVDKAIEALQQLAARRSAPNNCPIPQ